MVKNTITELTNPVIEVNNATVRQQMLYFLNPENEVKNRVFEIRNLVSDVTILVIKLKYHVIEVLIV